MKRMLCMILALVMALSLAVPAFAAVDNGDSGTTTKVTYEQDNSDDDFDEDGDGVVDDGSAPGKISETWTVIVPASMAPGETAEKGVVAYGYWDANRTLTVKAAKTVTLEATGYTDTYALDVTMSGAAATADKGGNTSVITVTNDATNNGFTVGGSNTDNCYATANITVDNFAAGAAPLFGTWEGNITYDVTLA